MLLDSLLKDRSGSSLAEVAQGVWPTGAGRQPLTSGLTASVFHSSYGNHKVRGQSRMTIKDLALRDSLLKCIKDAFDEVNSTRAEKIPTDALDEIYLYGQQGVFDSLQLVDFVVILEEKVAERIGAVVSIVSPKAVSRKANPFRQVSSLVDYVIEELALELALQET
jgi:hypothetical protein